jgi:tetratricopeptide (TPR) repeat protein
MVKGTPLLIGLSWRGALFSIAGILSDIVLLVLMLNLAGFNAGAPALAHTALINGFFATLALYQIVIIVGNVVPFDVVIEGARTPNDGKQFLGYVTGRTSKALEAYEKIVARYDTSFRINDSCLVRGNSPTRAVFSAADRDMAAGNYAEATQKYLRIIGETGMHPAEKAFILDRMACIPIMHGDKRFLSSAETWSRQARELLPQCRTLAGTLGAILVEKGNYSEGLALLMPLTEGNDRIDRLFASCYVAKALHRLGNTTEAAKWIETARSIGVEFAPIYSRIESEFDEEAVSRG